MTLNRFAARRDSNEPELVAAAAKMGWWLIKLKTPCDYLGFFRGYWWPIEIKGEKGKLTPAQEIFHQEARVKCAHILIWRNLHDVCQSTDAGKYV